MGKYDKLIISGEVQEDIDGLAMARIVIMLARRWQEQQEAPAAKSEPLPVEGAESEASG